MEFQALQQRALAIRQQYAAWEQGQYGRSWTRVELVLGLVGDVGDLVKLAMAHEGVRRIPDKENKLAHELADCLWSLIVIAANYDIDLEQAFLDTMDALEHHLKDKGT